MSFGLDYTVGPSLADLKAANVTFACRYLSEVNNLTKVKLLTPEEAKALNDGGIAIVSNYEWYANRTLEGAASGAADAQIARDQHAACGGPADRPIYFSVDLDTTGDKVAAYFEGVASVIGKARTGAYGSHRVLQYLFDHGLIDWGWQTYAWSGGTWEPRAHIQQYENGVSLAGHSVDYDRSMQDDFGQWRQGETAMSITIHSPGVANYFTEVDANHWQCKNGHNLHDGILAFYKQNNGLLLFGLPLSNEVSLDAHGNVLQYMERACLVWDQAHIYDSPPGAGSVYTAHVYDLDDKTKALGQDPYIGKLLAMIQQIQSQQPPVDQAAAAKLAQIKTIVNS